MSNYVVKARHRKEKILALLAGVDTKGDVEGSLGETLKTALVGLVAAGIGAKFSKPSLLIGLGAVMAAKYYKSERGLVFGVGLLAGGSAKLAQSLNGISSTGIAGIKETVKAYGEDLKDRLYLDKFFKSSNSTNGTDGVGEVQYFDPNLALDLGSLDAIEEEIARSSMRFDQRQFAGSYDEISGAEERIL